MQADTHVCGRLSLHGRESPDYYLGYLYDLEATNYTELQIWAWDNPRWGSLRSRLPVWLFQSKDTCAFRMGTTDHHQHPQPCPHPSPTTI